MYKTEKDKIIKQEADFNLEDSLSENYNPSDCEPCYGCPYLWECLHSNGLCINPHYNNTKRGK